MLLVSIGTLLTTVTDTQTYTVYEEFLPCLLTGSADPWIVEYGLGMWDPGCPFAKTSYVLLPRSFGVQDVLAFNHWKLFTYLCLDQSAF